MSRATDNAVGMMDAAYFIGRRELLEFFNDLLEMSLNKIEETASGAVACQLTEMIFPGSIPMSRVNWEARSDYEYIQNYKLLQNAFNKHHVQRFVDVNKLIRGKYQDNLEFCQWLKAFYDQSGVFREDYDAMATRARGKGGKMYNSKIKGKGRGSKPKPKPVSRPPPPKPSTTPTKQPERAIQPVRSFPDTLPAPEQPSSAPPSSEPATSAASEALTKENEELKEKVAQLESTVTTLEEAVLETEQERQFYFDKLRNVEIMLQVYQENHSSDDSNTNALMEKIFRILYATAEDNLTVNDEGEVVDASLEASLADNV